MTAKSPLLLILLLASTIVVRADPGVTLAAVNPVVKDRSVDLRDDFVVEIRNDSDQKINIAASWQVHALFVDGNRYQVLNTAWWCMHSPNIQPMAVYRRSMHLNFYSGLSLEPGVHEVQMEFGSVMSNKLQIITTGPRRGYTPQ